MHKGYHPKDIEYMLNLHLEIGNEFMTLADELLSELEFSRAGVKSIYAWAHYRHFEDLDSIKDAKRQVLDYF